MDTSTIQELLAIIGHKELLLIQAYRQIQTLSAEVERLKKSPEKAADAPGKD